MVFVDGDILVVRYVKVILVIVGMMLAVHSNTRIFTSSIKIKHLWYQEHGILWY